jgi:hypothetical protein
LVCCLYCTQSGCRCICHFPPALAYNLHSTPANGKQGPIPEEMSQTLLTKKKQGNFLDYVQLYTLLKLLSQTETVPLYRLCCVSTAVTVWKMYPGNQIVNVYYCLLFSSFCVYACIVSALVSFWIALTAQGKVGPQLHTSGFDPLSSRTDTFR